MRCCSFLDLFPAIRSVLIVSGRRPASMSRPVYTFRLSSTLSACWPSIATLVWRWHRCECLRVRVCLRVFKPFTLRQRLHLVSHSVNRSVTRKVHGYNSCDAGLCGPVRRKERVGKRVRASRSIRRLGSGARFLVSGTGSRQCSTADTATAKADIGLLGPADGPCCLPAD